MMLREEAERVAEVLRSRPDLLVEVAEYLLTDGLEDERSFELAERIATMTFGQRVECRCGSLVLPGFLCWGCEEWTAPEIPQHRSMSGLP